MPTRAEFDRHTTPEQREAAIAEELRAAQRLQSIAASAKKVPTKKFSQEELVASDEGDESVEGDSEATASED